MAADKTYYPKCFFKECRKIDVTPHVAQSTDGLGGSIIDGGAKRYTGYARASGPVSASSWDDTIGPLAQDIAHGLSKFDQVLAQTMAAYNLIRLRSTASIHALVA